MNKGNKEKQTGYMLAYNYLRNGIIEGIFPEDMIFVEETIAEELGVSRTPVREAIRMLKSEKLMISVAHKGVMGRILAPSEIKPVYEVAEALEGMMAYVITRRGRPEDIRVLEDAVIRMETAVQEGDMMAWMEADGDYHNQMMKASGNSFLVEAMENINVYIAMIRNRYSKQNPESRSASTVQHRAAYEAICSGDADYAKMVTQFHWRSIRRKLVENNGA